MTASLNGIPLCSIIATAVLNTSPFAIASALPKPAWDYSSVSSNGDRYDNALAEPSTGSSALIVDRFGNGDETPTEKSTTR